MGLRKLFRFFKRKTIEETFEKYFDLTSDLNDLIKNLGRLKLPGTLTINQADYIMTRLREKAQRISEDFSFKEQSVSYSRLIKTYGIKESISKIEECKRDYEQARYLAGLFKKTASKLEKGLTLALAA